MRFNTKTKVTLVIKMLSIILLMVMLVNCSTKPSSFNPVVREIEPFDEDKHDPRTILITLNHETVGFIQIDFIPSISTEGHIQIGVESFDQIAQKYSFEKMFQNRLMWDPNLVEDMVWLGYSPYNGFTLTLSDGSDIQGAVNALINDINILHVNYFPKEGIIYDQASYRSTSILICIDYQVHDYLAWGYEAKKNDQGQIQLGLESFDNLAVKFNFTDLRQLHLGVYRDNEGIYKEFSPMNNVFRILFDDADIIQEIYNSLKNDRSIIYVSYDKIYSIIEF